MSSSKLMLFYNFWQDIFYSWVGSVNLPYVSEVIFASGVLKYTIPTHTFRSAFPLLPTAHTGHPTKSSWVCRVQTRQPERHIWRRRHMSWARASELARCSPWLCISLPLPVRGSPLERHSDPEQQMYGQPYHFGSILSPSLYFFVILPNYSLYYVNIHNLSLEKNLNSFGREDE